MEKFVVDERIKHQFELYRNICDYLSEDYDSNFEQPAELSKIEQWEADNDTQLPYQYKSWLRLTSRALLLDGYIKFIWPMIGTLEEENDVVIIGARVGVEEEFGIERSSGIVYSIIGCLDKLNASFKKLHFSVKLSLPVVSEPSEYALLYLLTA